MVHTVLWYNFIKSTDTRNKYKTLNVEFDLFVLLKQYQEIFLI